MSDGSKRSELPMHRAKRVARISQVGSRRFAPPSSPNPFCDSLAAHHSEFAATGVLGNEGTEGWYQRVENNGWRAVTVKAQDELREDSVEIDSAAQTKGEFHFSKLMRKKDVQMEKKK